MMVILIITQITKSINLEFKLLKIWIRIESYINKLYIFFIFIKIIIIVLISIYSKIFLHIYKRNRIPNWEI